MTVTARFITLEGIEGSGKTTHLTTVQDFLNERGIDNVVTREPGGTQLGCVIRECLLSSEHYVSAYTELALFFADRAEHVKQVIQPALCSGKWVISDRFADASLAYQGGGRGIPVHFIRGLIKHFCNNIQPDLTLLFDIDAKKALQRAGERGAKDRFERECPTFFKRVQTTYLDMSRKEPQRWRVIDTSNSIAVTQQAVRKILIEFHIAAYRGV